MVDDESTPDSTAAADNAQQRLLPFPKHQHRFNEGIRVLIEQGRHGQQLLAVSTVRATLAAPLSHPQYQKNSDIGDQMLKKPLHSFPTLFPLSLHGLKIPLHPLYRGDLSSTPTPWDPLTPLPPRPKAPPAVRPQSTSAPRRRRAAGKAPPWAAAPFPPRRWLGGSRPRRAAGPRPLHWSSSVDHSDPSYASGGHAGRRAGTERRPPG
jgi:hypothetical protein